MNILMDPKKNGNLLRKGKEKYEKSVLEEIFRICLV